MRLNFPLNMLVLLLVDVDHEMKKVHQAVYLSLMFCHYPTKWEIGHKNLQKLDKTRGLKV